MGFCAIGSLLGMSKYPHAEMVSLTNILPSKIDDRMGFYTEVQYLPCSMDLLPRIFKALEVTKILRNTPCNSLTMNVFMIPSDQFLCISKVLGDGLLGQDMLACR